jgi:hypothetical protein
MTNVPDPFIVPVRLRELGTVMGQSYWSVRRLVLAGIAPTARCPDGDRILPDWANRYRRNGLTEDEMQRYRAYMREQRKPTSDA